MLYLGVSDTHESQRKILEALTRKFKLDPFLDLAVVASQCPFNYTGADFYALCSDAMLKAMSRKAEEIDTKLGKSSRLPVLFSISFGSDGFFVFSFRSAPVQLNSLPPDPNSPHPYPLTPQYYLSEIATPEEIAVLVGVADFEDALRELVPSVSGAEMEHYRQVQAQFSPPKAVTAAPTTNGAGNGNGWEEEAEGGSVNGVGGGSGSGSGSSKGKGKGKARA